MHEGEWVRHSIEDQEDQSFGFYILHAFLSFNLLEFWGQTLQGTPLFCLNASWPELWLPQMRSFYDGPTETEARVFFAPAIQQAPLNLTNFSSVWEKGKKNFGYLLLASKIDFDWSVNMAFWAPGGQLGSFCFLPRCVLAIWSMVHLFLVSKRYLGENQVKILWTANELALLTIFA